MLLTELSTYRFRNLLDTTISFHPSLNIFVGKNGQGKTNFIEALSVLSSSRSFRTSNSKELQTIGQPDTSLFGVVKNLEGEETKQGIIFGSKDSKQYLVNGDKVSLENYLGRLICVSFSPTDLSLIKGSPQGRRKFLDKLIVELNPHLLPIYGNYQRALQSKQALLKSKESFRPEDLYPWNTLMAEYGTRIIVERMAIIREFQKELTATISTVAPQDGEVVVLLESEFNEELSPNDILGKFTDSLRKAADQEVHSRSAKVGPHRDDFTIELDGKDARAFASQGQSRSLVIAIKLASMSLIESLRKISPLLLLDDVDSELDKDRLAQFLELLLSQKRQTFITGTEVPKYLHVKGTERADFTVENGRIL